MCDGKGRLGQGIGFARWIHRSECMSACWGLCSARPATEWIRDLREISRRRVWSFKECSFTLSAWNWTRSQPSLWRVVGWCSLPSYHIPLIPPTSSLFPSLLLCLYSLPQWSVGCFHCDMHQEFSISEGGLTGVWFQQQAGGVGQGVRV